VTAWGRSRMTAAAPTISLAEVLHRRSNRQTKPTEYSMRHMIAGAVSTIAAVFAFSPCAYAGSADRAAGKSDVETIRKLEEERNQAIIHGDAAALERMTSDDYTFVTLRGEMLGKAEIVRNFSSGAAKYQSRTISDLNIRVYGNSAVVTGRAVQEGAENGKDYSGDYWFTRVYVRQGGHWKTVALQTTLIKR
jgi:ketosteroid isomerase-like protein